MKNKIISIIIVFFGFFFFSCFNVSASTLDVTLDFDKSEHFNFYNEMINNSPFYRFIVSKGDSLDIYFNSFFNSFSSGKIFFGYSRDISSSFSSLDVPSNSYYIIYSYGSTVEISYHDNYFNIVKGCRYTESCSFNILFYDINMNYLGKSSVSSDNFWLIDYTNFDINYFLGSFYKYISSNYYLNWNSSTDRPFDVRVTDIVINSVNYNLKYLETRNGWSNFWSNIWNMISNSGNMYDLNDIGLGYLLRNYVITSQNGLISLFTAFSYNENVVNISVPDGFLSQTFSYSDRYYLVPNNLNCSSAESLLYFSTSDITTINFISYTLLNDVIDYDNIKTYSFQLKRANNIEALSLKSVIDSDNNISDNFYIVSSSDNMTSNTLYYNSSCFSLYSAVSLNDVEFVNINTGNDVVISPAEQQFIYYNSNNSIDNIIQENDISSNDVDITSIISGAWSGAKTFISSSYYILSMVTNLFVVLPFEVRGLLLCVFSLGMVVILWKVFRS